MGSKSRPITLAGVLALAGLYGSYADVAHAQSVEDLRQASIDDLANIDVSSVTKASQSLSAAPAAIYVITHDDIIRSGATSIPELLRLAPNLQVAQTGAGKYVITARGFSGNAVAQSYSNKLLVLIDGRSVYTPLFSGVYWDMQDTLLADIDRIEVISGPGATLWGANAVNGVINIITRKSDETQGGLLHVGGGNLERLASLRFGGRLGPNATWRVYAKGFYDTDTVTSTGGPAHDNWERPQGGFRLDWAPSSGGAFTLQGDAYQGADAQPGAPDEDIAGRNLMARWNGSLRGGSTLQVQGYYDYTSRATPGSGDFGLHIWDLDVQHSFALGQRNDIVWGGGLRVEHYLINGTAGLQFAPPSRTLKLANVFMQDSISVTDRIKLILGLKLEDDPYSGVTPLPSIRATWKANDRAMIWAAASRAIRSPTPFDRDVQERAGRAQLLGNPNFQSETLYAYEVGARVQPSSRLSFSVSGFFNVYNDLRTIEPAPATFFPITWGNMMQGHAYGVEGWGDYQVASWWRLTAAFNVLSEHLKFKPGASGILGVAQAGDDPERQASLRSSMNLGHRVTLDADLRYVAALPNPAVPSYVELNGRIGWNVTDRVQLALAGSNLLHDHHQEFPGPQANAAPRSVFADLRLRF